MQQPTYSARHVLWTAFILVFCFIILTIGAVQRHMRDDEGIAFDGTKGTLSDTLAFQARDVEAPAYFVIANMWERVIGDGEFTTRVLSLLTSLVTLAFVYRLGKDWLGGVWYGTAAIIGVCFSAYFFIYAIEIRPYALMMLAAALSMFCFLRWMKRPTWKTALLYSLTVALMLYEHYLGASLFAIQGVYFIGHLIIHRRTVSKRIVQGLAAYIFALILFLPWLPIFLSQVHHVGSMATAQNTTKIAGLGMVGTTLPTTPEYINRFILLVTNGQPLLYGLFLLAGLIVLWRKGTYWLILGWLIGLPALIFAVNLLVPIYEPRYAAHVVPVIGLLIAAAFLLIPGRWKFVTLGGFCVFGLLTVGSAVVARTPVRDYLKAAQAAYQPGDSVFLDISNVDHPVQDYQYAHYAPSFDAVIHSTDYKTLAEKIINTGGKIGAGEESPRCIWFVTNHLLDSDVQARFKALSENRPLQLVVGDQNYPMQRLCAPPRGEDYQYGEALHFLGVDTVTNASDHLTLKLWWEAFKSPGNDYSFGVYLLDNSGKLVAQQDGPIQDFYGHGTIQTSAWVPGITYIDLRTILFPTTLVPGTYQIALCVYQPWDLAKLPVTGRKDMVIPIGTYTKN